MCPSLQSGFSPGVGKAGTNNGGNRAGNSGFADSIFADFSISFGANYAEHLEFYSKC